MKLKKCPFCGGEAEVAFSGSTYNDNDWKGYIVVRCKFCRGEMIGGYYRGPEIDFPLEETKGGDKAIQMWNRRDGDWNAESAS